MLIDYAFLLRFIVERRLLTFVVASTAFFIFYTWVRITFIPPEPNPANSGAEVLVDEGTGSVEVTPTQGEEGKESNPEGETEGEQDVAGDSESTEEPVELERPADPTWLTLGSMAPDEGYFLLVTLNTRGGGIERIEMTERNDSGALRYRRVDVRSGYLGYLAAESSSQADGVVVNVVGPGTPAQAAGIQLGDVIVSLAGQTVTTREQLNQALSETKPGDDIQVTLLRGESLNEITVTAKLSEHPLDLVRLAKDGGADQVAGNLSRASCLLTLSQVNRKSIEPSRRNITGLTDPMNLVWDVDSNSSVTSDSSSSSAALSLELSASEMSVVNGDAVRLKRSYSLAPGSYDLGLSIQIDNLSDESQDLAYRLEGANGITLEGWWYSNKISPHWGGGAAARDIVCQSQAGSHRLLSGFNLVNRAKKETADPNETIFAGDSSEAERNLRYIGVDAQYFTVAYVPPEGKDFFTTLRRASAGIAAEATEIPRHQERAVNTTFFLDSRVAEVPAGSSLRQELRLFAGPKQPAILEKYGLEDCIYYGWFAAFAKILSGLLHVLDNVGNYALAIILLTVIVRGCMFPLSRKAAVNAQKMQELAPEMKKINERYKDDMEGKLRAQRELQQRVGFNPLAGCLPMFIQLPIFIGLYRALSVDIELRQAAVSSSTDWASNLAAPDMFLYWGDWLWDYFSGRGTGWLGPYFNLLPVIVVVLFLTQQKMFMPPATDEQTAMTQKMMNIMTLMMGLFFFRVPAGLCIYFITSSLWGICERILVKKTLPDTKHFDSTVLEGVGGKSEKAQGLVDRLKSQVAKPDMPIERPNQRKRPPKKK